eukprot:6261552-Pyramimonas_sp.AAC.1
MHLSLDRIGWRCTSAVTWLGDFERVAHLGFNGPALAGQMLRIGTQRHHERVLAELAPGFSGSRVATEPLFRLLSPGSKRFVPREKYMAIASLCGGIWARSRAKASGYDCGTQCPLGQEQD